MNHKKTMQLIEVEIYNFLNRNGWLFTQPNDENWTEFVNKIAEDSVNEAGEIDRRKLGRSMIKEYGQVLYTACTSEDEYQRNWAYSQLSQWIHRRVQFRIRGTDNVDDIVQDVLLVVFQNTDKISNPRVFLAYVGKIIWYKISEESRKLIRDMKLLSDTPEDFWMENVSGMNSQEDTVQKLINQAMEDDFIVRLRECFPRRASLQLDALILMSSGLSPREIAKSLNVSVGSAYALISRARKNILMHCSHLIEEWRSLGLIK